MGYQNELGFASEPERLSFVSGYHSCPGAVQLEAESLEINVFLIDQFNSIVHGQYLSDFNVDVLSSFSSDSERFTVTMAPSAMVEASSGAASFWLSTCGENNSTFSIQFQPASNSSGRITGVGCSILLNGCGSGFIPKVGSPCDICQPISKASRAFITCLLTNHSITCYSASGLHFDPPLDNLLLVFDSLFYWRILCIAQLQVRQTVYGELILGVSHSHYSGAS